MVESKEEMISRLSFSLMEENYEVLIMQRDVFDMIAKKDNTLLLIKVLVNIDSYSQVCAKELKKVAKMVNAVPIIIAEKGRNFIISDNIVYERFNIPVVNLKTFINYLSRKEKLLVYSKKGKNVIYINAEKMKKLREKTELSMSELAKKVNVTKKTIYFIEKEGKGSENVVRKIEDYFNENLALEIDLINWKFDEQIKEDIIQEKTENSNNILIKVYKSLKEKGLECYTLKKTPADILSMPEREKEKLGDELIACKLKEGFYNKKKLKMFKKFSEFCTLKKFILAKDRMRKIDNIMGIAVVDLKEIEEISDFPELVEIIEDRENK